MHRGSRGGGDQLPPNTGSSPREVERPQTSVDAGVTHKQTRTCTRFQRQDQVSHATAGPTGQLQCGVPHTATKAPGERGQEEEEEERKEP